MAILAENVTRCAICRRTLLVGEDAHIYQDSRTRAVQPVCRLCTVRAERAGWEHRGEQSVHRSSRLRASVPDGQPERLVRRLHVEMERLGDELKETQETVSDAGTGAVAARDAAIDARLQEAATLAARLEDALRLRDRRIVDLERSLAEAHGAQEALLKARRREADPAYLSGIACEVFNRSAQRTDLLRLAAQRGEPLVRVEPDGIGLPRAVLITFAWGEDRYAVRVACDLVARLFDVEDLSHGATRARQDARALRPNARLVDGRVLLDL